MSYPTPMDIAEAEDRLSNILDGLEEHLSESPFSGEEWKRMDAERLELLAANEALEKHLAQAVRDYEELREETDGGSESMTHVDAIDAIRTYREQARYSTLEVKSWAREAALNQQAADESAGYAARLAETEAALLDKIAEQSARMAEVQAHARIVEARASAMVRWLDANQPDVWKRGIWDAINAATADSAKVTQ